MSAARGRGHRYNPWLHARELGLGVVYEALPGDMCGAYEHVTSTVILDPRLTFQQERVTLAHEIVHHLHGHAGPQEPDVERAVDHEVLRRLVDFGALGRFLGRGFVVDKPLHRYALAYWLGIDETAVHHAANLLH